MKKTINLISIFIIISLLIGCGGKSSEPAKQTTNANGNAIKGPFIKGSTVIAYKLNSNGTRSNISKTTYTTDNLGTFKFDSLSWSGATEIVITGKYYNERDNNLSGPYSLSVIIDAKKDKTSTANINIFTHLATKHIKTLMTNNQKVTDAINTATKTIIQTFNLPSNTKLELLDINDSNNSATIELLKISAALAGKPSLIDSLSSALADGNITNDNNGSISFSKTLQAIHDINFTKIISNLEQNLSLTNLPDKNSSDDNKTYMSNLYVPIINSNNSVSIQENFSTQKSILTVNATDKDNDTITYSIIGGEDQNSFTIDSLTGQLFFKNSPDFENPQDSNKDNTYKIQVQASDQKFTNTQTISITVTNIPDIKPTIIPFVGTVLENTQLGATVGTLTIDNGDSNITALTLSGTNANHFSIDTNGTITVATQLDFESISQYTLKATATNTAGSSSADVNISIINTPDIKPTISTSNSFNIQEDATIGTVVGQVSITDTGDSDITKFILAGDDNSSFTIDTNGTIKTAVDLDFETKQKYNFIATAINLAGNSNNADVNITIIDIIDEPPIAQDGNFSMKQSDVNITINLANLVSDKDINDEFSFDFEIPNNGTIVPNTATTIIYIPNPGFIGTDTFDYIVKDKADLNATATISIEVNASAPSSGILVDPYITGAKCWADVNQDGIVDTNEISSISDINGSFTFNIFVPNKTPVIMLQQGLHNGKEFDGNLSAIFDNSKNGIISPITSLSKIGFSDQEIVNLFISSGFDNNFTVNELYLDPFDTSLLPLDGNMSNFSSLDINKFRRVLLANLIINNTLTMGNGYDMNKSEILSTFFADLNNDTTTLSPFSMMVDTGKILDENQLRNNNARVMARIFVTVFEFVRDQIKQDLNDPQSMMTSFQEIKSSNQISSIITQLNTAYQEAYSKGMIDPKFGWVNETPMLFVQPHELGKNVDINITYATSSSDITLSFFANHDYHEDNSPLGQWQIVDNKVQANNKEFELLGDKIRIIEQSGINEYNITNVTYTTPNLQ